MCPGAAGETSWVARWEAGSDSPCNRGIFIDASMYFNFVNSSGATSWLKRCLSYTKCTQMKDIGQKSVASSLGKSAFGRRNLCRQSNTTIERKFKHSLFAFNETQSTND
jgi:hypothetical protein